MKCIDIIIWRPFRRNTNNREKPHTVIGITNYDRCNNVYYLFGEIDHKNVNIDELINRYPSIVMIVETSKGYHFYFNISDKNPLRLIHRAFKLFKFLDKGHLKLGLKRYRSTNDKRKGFLVLRISPKYKEKDLKIIYYKYVNEYFEEIKKLILLLNSF